MRIAYILVASFLASPSIAQTDVIDGWPTTDICRAGVQVYFSLPEPPIHRGYNGFHQILSKAGNAFRCQVAANNTIRLVWTGEAGGIMRNESTRYSVASGQLTVTTDMYRQTFVRAGESYNLAGSGQTVRAVQAANNAGGMMSDADCRALRLHAQNNAETIYLFTKASSELANLRLQQTIEELLSTGIISQEFKEVTAMFSEASDHVDYKVVLEAAAVLNRLCPQ